MPSLEGALRALGRGPRLLTYIDLVQDIDVLLPVILAVRAHTRWRQEIVVAGWLAQASPRTARLLRDHGLPFRSVPRRAIAAGRRPGLRGVAALLSCAESSADTHTAAFRLAGRARAAGAATFTLQHGLENVGLHPRPDGGFECFASDAVFCWGPAEALPAGLPPETRAKLLPLGRPSLPASEAPPRFDVAVFENLHAAHYAEADRAAFLAGLRALLAATRGRPVLLRAHPAGGWLDGVAADLPLHASVTLVTSRQARADRESGREAAASAARVITTPSTVALDAAVAGRIVAVVGAASPLYEPLPRLLEPDDWVRFASAPADPTAARVFRRRSLLAGDAALSMLHPLAAAFETGVEAPN